MIFIGAILSIISSILSKNSENGSASANQYGITSNQLMSSDSIGNLLKRASNPRRDNETIFRS